MADILMRVELHEPVQAHAALAGHAWPWAKEQLRQGRELVAEFRLLEDDKTAEQRGYYHVSLEYIAQHARVNGEQFPMPVWKEFFRNKFLGFKVVSYIDPMTGRKLRRRHRISSEDLGVRGYSDLMDKVFAFAATDLGLAVPDPRPARARPVRRRRKNETIDAETGEILETT